MVVMIEIAVHAALVAAVGEVQLGTQRNAEGERFGAQFLHQAAHRDSPAGGFAAFGFSEMIGVSGTSQMACAASSRARVSASCNAAAGSTSYSGQIRRSTISSRGVAPS